MKKDSSDKFYWIGFITADGNISKNFLSLTIQLKGEDRGHLEKFKKFICSDAPIKEVYTTQGHLSYKITINSKELCVYLNDFYNVFPNKSLKMVFPDNIPKEYIKDYIRGFFDGDGSIYFTRKGQPTFSLSSGTKTFLETIKEKLDLDNVVNYSGQVWRISVTGVKIATKILNFLYEGSSEFNRLDRKYNRYLSIFNADPILSN